MVSALFPAMDRVAWSIMKQAISMIRIIFITALLSSVTLLPNLFSFFICEYSVGLFIVTVSQAVCLKYKQDKNNLLDSIPYLTFYLLLFYRFASINRQLVVMLDFFGLLDYYHQLKS